MNPIHISHVFIRGPRHCTTVVSRVRARLAARYESHARRRADLGHDLGQVLQVQVPQIHHVSGISTLISEVFYYIKALFVRDRPKMTLVAGKTIYPETHISGAQCIRIVKELADTSCLARSLGCPGRMRSSVFSGMLCDSVGLESRRSQPAVNSKAVLWTKHEKQFLLITFQQEHTLCLCTNR